METIAYQKEKLHIAITILVMAIIFLHSAMPGDLSSAESNIISRLIVGLTHLPDETVSLIIRKTAHFTEYMILGICFCTNVRDWKRKRAADLSGAESGIIARLFAGLTQLPDETVSLIVRKTAHFTEYMILAICFCFNVRDWMKKRSANLSGVTMVAVPWLLSSLYAVTDEIHQAFVPDRACALMDVGIDSAGALFGCIMILMIWKNSRRAER